LAGCFQVELEKAELVRQIEAVKLKNERLWKEIHALKTDPKLIERLAVEQGLLRPNQSKIIIENRK
jgi:hypothetical protein